MFEYDDMLKKRRKGVNFSAGIASDVTLSSTYDVSSIKKLTRKDC